MERGCLLREKARRDGFTSQSSRISSIVTTWLYIILLTYSGLDWRIYLISLSLNVALFFFICWSTVSGDTSHFGLSVGCVPLVCKSCASSPQIVDVRIASDPRTYFRSCEDHSANSAAYRGANFLAVPATMFAEQLAEVPKTEHQDRIQQQTLDQISDTSFCAGKWRNS